MFRRLLMLAISIFISTSVFAVGKPFDQASFDKDNAAGKSILVAIHADWCPTCKAQDPLLSELLKQNEYKDFVAYRVDYDSQKDAVKRFKVPMQSTILVFKNGKEVGRSTGETRKAALIDLMKKAAM